MSGSATNAPRKPPNGFIIVAVLWLLGGLATLVTIYAIYVMDTANAFTVHQERLQSEAQVRAALELTAQQLTSATAQSRLQHGSFSSRIGKANIAVAFQSEAARIDLNAAPQDLLTALFTSLDVNPERAADYADRIVRWRSPVKDPSLVGQASDANNDALRAARFFHVNELSLVPGLPMAVTERALPLVTIYNGRPQVNVFEAAPDVLAALPGMYRERLDAVVAQRQILTDTQALLRLFGPAQPYVTTEGSNVFRVSVQVSYDNGHRVNSEVIIVPFDSGPEPYAILSWQDELAPPGKKNLQVVAR